MLFLSEKICLQVEKNETYERNALIWHDSLLNFKCLATKHVMSGTLLEHVFFLLCPRLDTTDGICTCIGKPTKMVVHVTQ